MIETLAYAGQHRPMFGALPPEEFPPRPRTVGRRGQRRSPEIPLDRVVDLSDIEGKPIRAFIEAEPPHFGLVTLPIPAGVATRTDLPHGAKLAAGLLLLRARTHRKRSRNKVKRSLTLLAQDLAADPKTVGRWLRRIAEIVVHEDKGQARDHVPNTYEVPESWMESASSDVYVPLYFVRLLSPRDALAAGAAYTAMGPLGVCWTGQHKLGDQVGLDRFAVGRGIRKAVEAGLIHREKQRAAGGVEFRMWLRAPAALDHFEVRSGVDLRDHVFAPERLNGRQDEQNCPQPEQHCPEPEQVCGTQEEHLKEHLKEPPPVGSEGRTPAATQRVTRRHRQPEGVGPRAHRSLPTVADLAARAGLDLGKGSAGHGGVECPVCGAKRRHTKQRDKRMACNILDDGRAGQGFQCMQCDAKGSIFDVAAHVLCKRPWNDLGAPERGEVLDFMFEGQPADEARGEAVDCPPAGTEHKAKSVGHHWHPADEVNGLLSQCVPITDNRRIVEDLGENRRLNYERIAELGLAVSLPPDANGVAVHDWASEFFRKGRRLITLLYSSDGERRGVTARSGTEKRRMKGSGSTRGLVMANPAGQLLLSGEIHGIERVVIAEGETDFFAASVAVGDDVAVFGIGSGMWTRAHADRVPDGVVVVIATDTGKAGDRYAADVVATFGARELRLQRWRPPAGYDCRDLNDVVKVGLKLELHGYLLNPRSNDLLGLACPNRLAPGIRCSGELIRRSDRKDVIDGQVVRRTRVGCTSWSPGNPGCGWLGSLADVDRAQRRDEARREELLDQAHQWLEAYRSAVDGAGADPSVDVDLRPLLIDSVAAMQSDARALWIDDLKRNGAAQAEVDVLLDDAASISLEEARRRLRKMYKVLGVGSRGEAA